MWDIASARFATFSVGLKSKDAWMYFANAHTWTSGLICLDMWPLQGTIFLRHFLWLNMGFALFVPTPTEHYLFVLPIKCSYCLLARLWFSFRDSFTQSIKKQKKSCESHHFISFQTQNRQHKMTSTRQQLHIKSPFFTCSWKKNRSRGLNPLWPILFISQNATTYSQVNARLVCPPLFHPGRRSVQINLKPRKKITAKMDVLTKFPEVQLW